MSFILKIYFFGLIAFVPNENGKEMTALLVDARPGYHTSDGSHFPPHRPILLAKAGNCTGDCRQDDAVVAPYLFGRDPGEALTQLKSALGEGRGVWNLDGHHIAIQLPTGERTTASLGVEPLRDRRRSVVRSDRGTEESTLPSNRCETEDASWIAEIPKVVPEAGAVDPDCLAENPTKGLIAGRVKLTAGKFKTYRLAAYQDQIPKFFFKPLVGTQPSTDYSQGLADWTVVEIPVSGCQATLTARKFGTQEIRSMELRPADCNTEGQVVEVALLNLPDESLRPQGDADHNHPPSPVGTHFEMFYELSKNRPSWRQRAVPYAESDVVSPDRVDPVDSNFLSFLKVPRAGTYSLPICPQAVFAPSPDA